MFNRKTCSLVVQGPIYKDWTRVFLDYYKSHFDNVIISTWVDQDIKEDDGIKLIKSDYPTFPGGGNMNYQLVSSLNGCKAIETDFVIKVRSDIKILEIDRWLDFFSKQWIEDRVFVLGLSKIYPFSSRDQIYAGKTKDMILLFDIPLLDEPWRNPAIGSELYPELYITLHYYAKFSEKVRAFLKNPENYLYSAASLKHEVMEEWNKIGTKYMLPVSRFLEYYWPKRFGEGRYNYDETKVSYGEFWYEDII